jgi:ankyrin repeat protein
MPKLRAVLTFFQVILITCLLAISSQASLDEPAESDNIPHREIHSLELYLRSGGNPNKSVSPSGATMLILSASRGDARAVSLLLLYKANVNASDSLGWSPLMHAVKNGKFQVAKMLIDAGSSPDAQAKFGATPLMLAIESPNPEIMTELILSHGVNINAQTQDGTTALMLAATNGKAKVVKMLLNAGADPTIKNSNGTNAIMLALMSRDAETFRLLGGRQLSPIALSTIVFSLALSCAAMIRFKRNLSPKIAFVLQIGCYLIVGVFVFLCREERMLYTYWLDLTLKLVGSLFIVLTLLIWVRATARLKMSTLK